VLSKIGAANYKSNLSDRLSRKWVYTTLP
jgi:hypothetical protein